MYHVYKNRHGLGYKLIKKVSNKEEAKIFINQCVANRELLEIGKNEYYDSYENMQYKIGKIK